jgi:hypothetical protein
MLCRCMWMCVRAFVCVVHTDCGVWLYLCAQHVLLYSIAVLYTRALPAASYDLGAAQSRRQLSARVQLLALLQPPLSQHLQGCASRQFPAIWL